MKRIRIYSFVILLLMIMAFVTGCTSETETPTEAESVAVQTTPVTEIETQTEATEEETEEETQEPTKASTSKKKSSHPYISVINKINKEAPNKWSKSYYQGALCDINYDGVDELIAIHTIPGYMPNSTESTFSVRVCSVYTIINNKAVCVLEDEFMFNEIGGPGGAVYVVEKDGSTYLRLESETGETSGPNMHRNGENKFFEMYYDSMSCVSETSYNKCYDGDDVDYGSSDGIIDGVTVSYSDYEAHMDSYSEVLKINIGFIDDSPYALSDLKKSLENQ